MQQRVSLARVLVNDPELLLLDEPASGLDPRARIELMQILQALRGMGKTVFISSHILSELAELCDSVTIIDRGCIKYTGLIDELLTREAVNPTFRVSFADPHPDIEEQLGNLPGVVLAEAIEGGREYRIAINTDETSTDALLRGVLDLNLLITGFNKDRKHLNQAFMDLTERGVL
jgi:ABC-2 type transport system ATP-binding protein